MEGSARARVEPREQKLVGRACVFCARERCFGCYLTRHATSIAAHAQVQLIGQIELATERGNPHAFVSLGEVIGCNSRCLWAATTTGQLGTLFLYLHLHLLICLPVNARVHISNMHGSTQATCPHKQHVPTPAVRELAPPGVLTNVGSYPFEFRNVEMQYDSYRGNQVRNRSTQAQRGSFSGPITTHARFAGHAGAYAGYNLDAFGHEKLF